MHYVSAGDLKKSYGLKPLFEKISFNIEEGDKIALVARNGSGKTTLLKILAGLEVADEGKLWIHKDVDIAFFEQDPVFVEEKSILDNIFFHDHPVINAIKDYEAIAEEGDAQKLSVAIVRMDELGAWDFESRVKQVLGKLNIHHLQQKAGSLSGGERKRVALAKTLIDIGFEHKHVLLIMDEPTNHLDVEMVEWLEYYLNKENVTLLLVTHDRYFLDSVCDEIWELDAGELYVYKGDYENYLEKKAMRLETDQSSLEKARNTYRKELEWMRKQPRARTTKSKSRQDRFYEVEAKANKRMETTDLQLQSGMNRLGGKIVEIKKLTKSFGEKVILKGFDYTFKKGDRIGIVGKNGVGKSTFLELLLGIQQADSGKINIGETVVFGHFSQGGLKIEEDMRVIEYVKSMAENFPLAGGGSLGAAQFLELFLFPSDQQYTYVSKLSGGEKKRLQLLSILFRNPNFLILDEPTNDLDLPTLTVLENFLSGFQGCFIIVSHDRYFMDRLVDHLFVFEGDGIITDFPGNYSQYRLAQGDQRQAKEETAGIGRERSQRTQRKRKLSFKEKIEFENLGKQIEMLNKEKELITQKLNSGNLPFEELEKCSRRIGELTHEIDEKEMRWLELSEIEE